MKPHRFFFSGIFLIPLFALAWCADVSAALITVTTNDTYAKIEGANPGDEVVLAPGTYRFRVYLTRKASETNRIFIHALDPSNPPIWDFGTNLVENAPGSYGAGDRGRGGWQFSAASSYHVSGIVFRNCHNAAVNSSGVRYYNGTTNLLLSDCVFTGNDVGLTGGTQDSQATVEFCEFNANGNLSAPASAPTHNIYIYGGYLALRYCYVHDSVQGQNFHIRCRNATLEYNWFARANNYDGDLMTDDDFSGAGPFSQTLTLRGNVFVQNTRPGNHSQVIALYNDAGQSNLTLNLRMLYNTFIGANTNSAFVHVSNADGTPMTAELSDNIIYGTRLPASIEDPNAASVSGANNWMQANAFFNTLTNGNYSGTVQTPAPGFLNPGAQNYHLAPGSACIGTAYASVFGLPGKEYRIDEVTNRRWRPRAAAHDIGAFESTSTDPDVGAYDLLPRPRVTIRLFGSSVVLSWPLFSQDYALYESDLTPPMHWGLSAYSASTNADGMNASMPLSGPQRAFRLRN